MELKGMLLVLLVSLLSTQDAEAAICRSDYGTFMYCSRYPSTYCCPFKSYSNRYYGTTFSTCCNYAMASTHHRYYCRNALLARYYCTGESRHCCASKMFTSGKWMSGCCYRSTTTKTTTTTTKPLVSCRYKPEYYATCWGSSTYCCPHLSYSFSHYGTRFATCCDGFQYSSPASRCHNYYETYWCRAPFGQCCPSRTTISGAGYNACCAVYNSRPTTNIGAIVGGGIGGIIIIVIISVTIGVLCCKRTAPPTSGPNTGTVMQGGTNMAQGRGYPQPPQMVAYPPQTAPVVYAQQRPYVVGGQPAPVMPGVGAGYPAGYPPASAQPQAMPNAAAGAQPVVGTVEQPGTTVQVLPISQLGNAEQPAPVLPIAQLGNNAEPRGAGHAVADSSPSEGPGEQSDTAPIIAAEVQPSYDDSLA